jgi:hypothetical protein
MTDDITQEEFVDRWKNHVDTLTRIGFNLSEKKDRDKLEDIQEEIMELVEKASEERKEGGFDE